MSSTLTTTGNYSSTSVTMKTVATTTTFTTTTVSFFDTADGRTVLAFLILIFLLLIAIPIVTYVIIRKFCWIKVHSSGQGEWSSKAMPAPKDRHKKTQTDVKGSELEEFYRRRQPPDMTTYEGKQLPTITPKERWHQLNPKKWNDPWVSKFPKDSSYINKLV